MLYHPAISPKQQKPKLQTSFLKELKSHTSSFAKFLQLEEVKWDSENLANLKVGYPKSKPKIEHTSSTNSSMEYYSILIKPRNAFCDPNCNFYLKPVLSRKEMIIEVSFRHEFGDQKSAVNFQIELSYSSKNHEHRHKLLINSVKMMEFEPQILKKII